MRIFFHRHYRPLIVMICRCDYNTAVLIRVLVQQFVEESYA
jgi:hypothetical protein